MSEFTRNCPKCQRIIRYKNEKILRGAIREGKNCLKCRPTKRKLTSEEWSTRRVSMAEYQREYRRIKKDELRVKKNEYRLRVKAECFTHYGNKCSCCKETEYKFLTLEHKNGRWKNGKKDLRTGSHAYQLAKKEGYPETYTILCFNCNSAKGLYGKCPHENN